MLKLKRVIDKTRGDRYWLIWQDADRVLLLRGWRVHECPIAFFRAEFWD
jgi:hypothetical protein